MSTWFITGCSAGLGRALARTVLEDGHSVVVTARDPGSVTDLVNEFPDHALAVALDVTDSAACDRAVEAAHERFGHVDVLVNNAGYGYRAAIEEAPDADIRRQFDTHFFGPIRLIQAVLPGMRARRKGAIVNVSSIGARWISAGSGFYAASKLALEGASLSLQKEVAPLGIDVIVVEPGPFRTEFLGRSLAQSPTAIADYADTAGARRIERVTGSGQQPGDPTKAARAIVQAVEAPTSPALIVLGSDAIDGFNRSTDELRAEVEAWADVGRGTAVDD